MNLIYSHENEYAHENGYSWSEVTADYAAGGGHLECLKYCHENDCLGMRESPLICLMIYGY